MTHVDLGPDDVRLAEDGRWYAGELMAYRRGGDGIWSGWVHWTAGVGRTYVDWLPEDRLRRHGSDPVA